MTTIKEVAKKANVSLKTVSRVINSPSKVADKTRQKVEKAIKKLGYRPDPVAQRLRRKVREQIVLYLHDVSCPEKLENFIPKSDTVHYVGLPVDVTHSVKPDPIVALVKHCGIDLVYILYPVCEFDVLVSALEPHCRHVTCINPFLSKQQVLNP